MVSQISAVINTLNEEKNIERAIKSVNWVDEILVCDMHSDDKTVEVAKKLGAKVVSYKRLEYVEPARNFAVSKTSGEWILILDPDEELPDSLKERLLQIASKMNRIDYVRIPRKNLIFGKWMKDTGWWPDYNIRFFKKGKVKWSDKIHRPPEVLGEGLDLEADEKWAIIHHNYQNLSQFISRMNRYTAVEASQLKKNGYKFTWKDLINKPLNEFFSRFFARRGYEDGIHGLALSFLQAFSFFIVYLKIWEMEGFKQEPIDIKDLNQEKEKSRQALDYWFKQTEKQGNILARFMKTFRQ